MRQSRARLMTFLFWLTLVGLYWAVANRYELSPEEVIKQFADFFVNTSYGPLLFILFFALQPLIFFPSSLMGVAGGYLYGPMWGLLYAVIGANGAGMVSYLVGYFFGGGEINQFIERYTQQIRHNSFETLLMMHLIFLPYDLVNYFAGFLRVKWHLFVLATALGSLPGTITLVFFGASIEGNLMSGDVALDFSTLAISGVTLIVSLSISRYLKWRRRAIRNPTEKRT